MTAEQLEERNQKRRAYQKQYVIDNPEKVKASRKKSYYKRRREIKNAVWEIYQSKCNCCGDDDPDVLELDHVFGGGSKERREVRNHFELWTDIVQGLEDVSLYQLLCANCHKKKTKNIPCHHED